MPLIHQDRLDLEVAFDQTLDKKATFDDKPIPPRPPGGQISVDVETRVSELSKVDANGCLDRISRRSVCEFTGSCSSTVLDLFFVYVQWS
jgi:hypothetical protein